MKYRTLWISDLHLGTRGCDALALLDFLRRTECERLYLVGDVVDLWQLRRNHYWPQSHNDVVQKILRKARKGTEVILIPGNHDEFLGSFTGRYGGIAVKPRDLRTTATGRRLLVMHGHEFDAVTAYTPWVAQLGDHAYSGLLSLNRPLNFLRRRLGFGHWSFSAYVKSRVKGAVNFISRYEEAVAHYAALHRADGIVCGHIHSPAMRRIRGTAYYNTGDWVESRTALAEHADGRIELLRWNPADAGPAGAAAPAEPAVAERVGRLALEPELMK